jgi:hypothetical protein
MLKMKRSREGIAASPNKMLAANARCGGGDLFIDPTPPDLQAAITVTARRAPKPVYLLRLQPKPDIDDIRALRWALKKLLRLGFRCLAIEVYR